MSVPSVRPRRGRAWDEASIREELTAFLTGRTRWPTYREFIAAGAKGLREAVSRVGGDAYWAAEMGLAGTQHPPGGVVRWTDQAIEAVLSLLLAGRDTWPTRTEFEKAGLRGLGEVLRERDEASKWAQRMGVAPPQQIRRPSKRRAAARKPQTDAAPKRWPRWTDQTITAALAEFLAERQEWPKHSEFVATGRKGLYHAVLKHGGSQLWAERMGVRWVDRTRRHRPWTEAEVRAQLQAFLEGQPVWPTERQFADAGHRDLLRAARRLGGAERWRRELGLSRSQPPPRARPEDSARSRRLSTPHGVTRAPARRHWTDQRIDAAIRPLVEQLGRWPTKAEFRRAGQSHALSAVYAHGGSAQWQQHFGVQPLTGRGPVPDRTRWTEQRIERELRTLIARIGRWPTEREFSEYGPVGLYSALVRHGGIRRWRDVISEDPPDPVAARQDRVRCTAVRWSPDEAEIGLGPPARTAHQNKG